MKTGGYTNREIAKVLKRDRRTIDREVARNKLKKKGEYDAQKADHKAHVRQRAATFQGRHIRALPALEKYIIAELKVGRSPEAISGRMKRLDTPWYASKTAIYDWLYSCWGQRYTRYLASERPRKKRRTKKKTKRSLIPNRISIHKRPRLCGNNHYEVDSIVSGKHTRSRYALITLTNITTGYVLVKRIPNMKPETFYKGLRILLKSIKKPTTLTFDNGQENRLHEKLGIKTFFCDPYASWQKPQVENSNKLIRRDIPKGSDIRDCSPQFIRKMVTKLNHSPKKKLAWLTPHEVMLQNRLLPKTKKPPL